MKDAMGVAGEISWICAFGLEQECIAANARSARMGTASAGLLRTLTSYAMGSLMPTRFLRLEETCHMLSGCRIGRVSLVVSPVDGPGTGSVRHDHDEAAGHRQILPEMQHLIQVVEIGVEEQRRHEAEPGKNERSQPRGPA